jgi:hypothetical protein
MATVTPNFNWPVPTSTDLVKDGATAIEALGDSIDGSLVDLKGGTTGQVLSKTSGTDMDFTWVTTDDANAIQNSIVDAKGDLISATANDTPARLAVGANGETLVADSSASTGLRYQGNFAAGKNKIINGDFGIWQRGTSTNSASAASTFLADRWVSRFDYSSGTASLSQQTFTPGTAPVAGYEGQYFLRLTMPSGASSYGSLGQKIEDVRTLAGQTVTVSFWAKSSSAQSASILLRQDFGTGGSASVDLTTNYSLTTAWQRFTWTTTLASITGKTIGTGSNLTLQPFIYGIYTSSSTLDIWGVQVEAGNVATAFQTATGTIQGELAACQRYYWRSTAENSYSRFTEFNTANSATTMFLVLRNPVRMRVKPSSIEYSTLQGYDGSSLLGAVSALTLGGDATNDWTVLTAILSGMTQFRPTQLIANNSTSAYLGLSAEL